MLVVQEFKFDQNVRSKSGKSLSSLRTTSQNQSGKSTKKIVVTILGKAIESDIKQSLKPSNMIIINILFCKKWIANTHIKIMWQD